MLSIHNTMINEPLVIDTPLERWTISEVIMIPKDKDTPKINRLRVINKYEADYNLILKYFWPKSATKLTDKNKIIGENQWGTKTLCSAEHPALLDQIITDINRITCRNLVKLQNDATSYFDRMITDLTTLCCRIHNVLELTCKLQSSTLNTMKYKIITALGTSQQSYSTTKQKSIHGTCQGFEASGSNWLFTSVPMMDTIEQNCERCTIYSPDKKITWVKHILGLVDDARQYANDWNNNNIVQILNNLQHSSQT